MGASTASRSTGSAPATFETELNVALVENPEFNAWVARPHARRALGRARRTDRRCASSSPPTRPSFVNGQVLYVDGGVLFGDVGVMARVPGVGGAKTSGTPGSVIPAKEPVKKSRSGFASCVLRGPPLTRRAPQDEGVGLGFMSAQVVTPLMEIPTAAS